MNGKNVFEYNKKRPADHSAFMYQVVQLIRQVNHLSIVLSPDSRSFKTEPKKGISSKGIRSVEGEIGKDSILAMRAEVLNAPQNIKISARTIFNCLSDLGEKITLIKPKIDPITNSNSSLWIEMKVKATPMSFARSSLFLRELKKIDQLAIAIQTEIPSFLDTSNLNKLYKHVSTIIKPVIPFSPNSENCSQFNEWNTEILDFLDSNLSIALSSTYPVALDFIVANIASHLNKSNHTLGRLTIPALNPKAILEISEKSPGFLVVPAVRISMGGNLYEIGNDIQNILNLLSDARQPVLFTGSYAQLQHVFHGGQGAVNDPLLPVVKHVPDIPIAPLIKYLMFSLNQEKGGLSKKDEDKVLLKVNQHIKNLSPHEVKRILPAVMSREFNLRTKTDEDNRPETSIFVSKLCGLGETLAGLSSKPRSNRSLQVQESFNKQLTHQNLLPFLKSHLLAQDEALGLLVARLQTECLTRPNYQPIRFVLQGTPGTGKSESVVLIARKLNIPYINIDAASIPDYYTASAQLLGSGRGIVGSFQSGRLEQASKHHLGAVIEISDLDHAVPNVRSSLSDLFLQVLETGEAQSATGAMFSCANLIFAFTINLPHGLDERIRKGGVGFNNKPSQKEIKNRVNREIKQIFSGAFLSRIGTPILFSPLAGETLIGIIEHSILQAIIKAAERARIQISNVFMEEKLGKRIFSSLESNIFALGARTIMEHARNLSAQAFLEFKNGVNMDSWGDITISAESNNRLTIKRGK